MPPTTPLHEPHKIKTVRLISFPTLEERKRNLSLARFNTFELVPSQVSFDMLSYGTSAMSQEQIAGQLVGDEAYAGARNFETLVAAVNRVLGHTYVCPTHNSLGAIKLIVATLTPKGSLIPSNARSRIDLHAPRGIEIADVRDRYEKVFTGNVDVPKLDALLAERKAAIVGLQCFADGQHPFSLANLRAVREVADRHGLRVVLDVSRVTRGRIELVKDRKTKEPMAPWNSSSPEMAAVKKFCTEKGLFLSAHWHTLLIIPPLPITEAQLQEGFDVLDKALEITDQAAK